MRIGPSSLRSRLALLFAVGTATVMLAAGVVLYVVLDHELSVAIDQGLAARSVDLGAVVADDGGVIPNEDPFAQLLAPDGTVVDQSPPSSASDPVLKPEEVSGLHGTTTFDRDVRLLGGSARLRAATVDVGGSKRVLVVGASLDSYERARARLGLVLGIATPLLAGMVAVAGWLLAGAALRPVRRLAEEADSITITELGRRLPVPDSRDELEQLARTLNAMLDRLEGAIAHERMFVDDASHELRTPISILRGELELALARPGDASEIEDALRSALDEAIRLGRLADDLLALARARAGELQLRYEPIDLVDAARAVASTLDVPPEVSIACEGDRVMVAADPDRVDQMLMNLLSNALRYATSRVQVSVSTSESGQSVELVVADDGPGFSASILPVRFERFTRADLARRRDTGGAGLGLSIVAALVRAHLGTIEAGNGPEPPGRLAGAWVRIRLPVGEHSGSTGGTDPARRVSDPNQEDPWSTPTLSS